MGVIDFDTIYDDVPTSNLERRSLAKMDVKDRGLTSHKAVDFGA